MNATENRTLRMFRELQAKMACSDNIPINSTVFVSQIDLMWAIL